MYMYISMYMYMYLMCASKDMTIVYYMYIYIYMYPTLKLLNFIFQSALSKGWLPSFLDSSNKPSPSSTCDRSRLPINGNTHGHFMPFE